MSQTLKFSQPIDLRDSDIYIWDIHTFRKEAKNRTIRGLPVTLGNYILQKGTANGDYMGLAVSKALQSRRDRNTVQLHCIKTFIAGSAEHLKSAVQGAKSWTMTFITSIVGHLEVAIQDI